MLRLSSWCRRCCFSPPAYQPTSHQGLDGQSGQMHGQRLLPLPCRVGRITICVCVGSQRRGWKSGPCRSCILGSYFVFAYLVKENAGGKDASMPRKSKKRCIRNWAHLSEKLKARCRRRNFSFLEGKKRGGWRSKAKQNGEKKKLLWIFSRTSDKQRARECSFTNPTIKPRPPPLLRLPSAKGTFQWWYCCCWCCCCLCGWRCAVAFLPASLFKLRSRGPCGHAKDRVPLLPCMESASYTSTYTHQHTHTGGRQRRRNSSN